MGGHELVAVVADQNAPRVLANELPYNLRVIYEMMRVMAHARLLRIEDALGIQGSSPSVAEVIRCSVPRAQRSIYRWHRGRPAPLGYEPHDAPLSCLGGSGLRPQNIAAARVDGTRS